MITTIWLKTCLESSNSSRLEPEISFEILSNFSHETLEGQLPDEELGRLLVSSDLTESDGSWPVSVGLLDSSGSGGRFAGSLGGQLLPGGLASSGLASGLLGTSHFYSSELTDDLHCPAPDYIGLPGGSLQAAPRGADRTF